MLIKPVTMEDIPTWMKLSWEYDDAIKEITDDLSMFYEGFDDYMKRKILQEEAYMAVDSIVDNCMGIIAFSKKHNRITFFATLQGNDMEYVGAELMTVAIEHLDRSKDIRINAFKGENDLFRFEKQLFERFRFKVSDDDAFELGVPVYEMTRIGDNTTPENKA